MLKKSLIIFLLTLSLLPAHKLAAQSSNAGFVPGNIWYSKDPFEDRDKVKIYTIVFNPDEKELSGTISFFDKNTLLGKKEFMVEGLGVQDISIDWAVVAGEHVIFAKIENAKFLTADGKYENVVLVKSETEESRRSVAKKIIVADENEEKDSILDTDTIKKVILERTPNFISEPIVESVNVVEEFRQEKALVVSAEKEETKKEIEALNKPSTTKEEVATQSRLEKPFKNTKLFFLKILSFFLNNVFAFYGSSSAIVFLIGRYLLRKIL